MGRKTYPEARELLITADGGGSNGSRVRLCKVALQRMANATGLKISVCHFPPGTSKWNKIEDRMFCHITRNWRGRPLESHEVIVNLIASTTTTKGLRVRAALHAGRSVSTTPRANIRQPAFCAHARVQKCHLKEMQRAEGEAFLGQRPDLSLVKLADGAHDNWSYLGAAFT